MNAIRDALGLALLRVGLALLTSDGFDRLLELVRRYPVGSDVDSVT